MFDYDKIAMGVDTAMSLDACLARLSSPSRFMQIQMHLHCGLRYRTLNQYSVQALALSDIIHHDA